MIRPLISLTFACLLAFGLRANEHPTGGFETSDSIAIDLFAAEPDTVDPVSLTFAADGACFVVEMRDYPYGVGPDKKPGGAIRLLRRAGFDSDQMTTSTVFASGLSFPTSIMAWRDGVLVLAPPEIRFLKDNDGDDVADINEVVVTGLRRGVTDSNANSLRLGIDNRIHVANGGNGGKVQVVGSDQPRLSLGNSDFAIDLENKTIIKTARTGGGFGLVFDDFGRSFTTHNLDYLQQRIIPIRYLEQSPEMYSFKATENISDHGVSARIYPIVQAVTRVNHPEQAGRFSSAGGMGILNSKKFSDSLAGSIFVCDVVCNIVHRDVLRMEGPAYRAARAADEQEKEFIASKDPAFRPVGLEPGPGGDLFLIDMQRDVIEHPDYIPARVREKLDIRGGHDRGRIYRVRPNVAAPQITRIPPTETTEQLVGLLESPHAWERTTGQRLLIERRPDDAVDLLCERGLTSKSPVARAHSLWLLDNLGFSVGTYVAAALSDPNPGVRENAIQLAEKLYKQGKLSADRLLEKLADEDARVRFQAALSLDGYVSDEKLDRLFAMLIRDAEYKWSRRAVLISIDKDARSLLMKLWNSGSFRSLADEATRHQLIHEVADVAAATADQAHDRFATWLTELPLDQSNPGSIAALMSGLDAGWRRRAEGRFSPQTFAQIAERWAQQRHVDFEPELIDLISLYEINFPASMNQLFANSRSRAADIEQEESVRIAAIEILAHDHSPQSFDLLIKLLSDPETTAVQQAVVRSLGELKSPATGPQLLEAWSSILPGIRSDVINLLLSRREYQSALLTALETGSVDFGELNLDLEQRRRLLRWSSRDIGQRAEKLFGDEEYSNRKAIVDQWLAKLPDQIDLAEGKQVFGQKCATCHVASKPGETSIGHRVGPDLQSLSHRSVEDLLSHILDPNMSINPNYVSCVVQTLDGQVVNGLIADETSESITLRQAEGKSITIARAEIEELKTLKTSLMPEGLEKEISPAQMRSLIAYLQQN